MNQLDLRERVAIITGGARGIGYAAAERALRSGASVVLWDIDSARVERAVAELAPLGTVTAEIVELSDAAAVAGATDATLARHGRIDILVNNAGITGGNATTWELDPDVWRRVLEVNLTGAFLTCRAVVPHMIARGYGRIVNVASVAGKEGNPNASHYSASKAGLIGLTKSLAKELAPRNIVANCITPAAARTEIFNQMKQEHVDYMLARIPMGRFLELDEVAALICWLSSEDCSFSTGAVFDISGGRATYSDLTNPAPCCPCNPWLYPAPCCPCNPWLYPAPCCPCNPWLYFFAGGRRRHRLRDSCRFDVVEPRKRLCQVGVALRLDQHLIGCFAMLGVDLVDDLHARHDLTERREPVFVEEAVVPEVDEELRRARVRTARGKCDEAALVALRDRVVFQVRVAPDGIELGIAVDAELHHELRNDPEETPAVEVAVLHQVVETIRAIRRPGARDFDDEGTNRRVEVGAEGGWRRLLQLGRRSERGIDRGRLGSRGLRGEPVFASRASWARVWPDSASMSRAWLSIAQVRKS